MNTHPTTWLRTGRLDAVIAALGLVVALGLLPLAFLSSEAYVQSVPVVLGLGCLLYLVSIRRDASVDRSRWTIGEAGSPPRN
ncbi:hypothetical protein ACFQL4_11490 [Halosimplex aquaticum]